MVIGTLGLEFGSGNKGCEALAFSFYYILNEVAKKNNMIIDVINFMSCDVDRISREVGCTNLHIESISLGKFYEFKKRIKLFKKCDLIYDFTAGDSFSDIYGIKRFFSGTIKKQLVINSKVPLVLGGQTYGPYKNFFVKIWARNVIKKAYKVYARDLLSKQLAENISKRDDIMQTIDLAFVLPYDKEKYKFKDNKKIKVGINFSGLLFADGYNGKNQFNMKFKYKDYCIKLLEKLINTNKYDIYLIPHVIYKDLNIVDNDLVACEELKKIFPDINVSPYFETPMEAKSFISNMDVFIGSRMHATIAAISSGVATIPVSYSKKFEGLFSSLNYNYVISGTKTDLEETLSQTMEYIDNYKKLENEIELTLFENNTKQLKAFIENDFLNMLPQNNEFYKKYCTGCGICESKKKATLEVDKDGISRPINESKDFSDFCQKICPINGKIYKENFSEEIWGKCNNVYRGYASNKEIRYKGSSGGVITALCVYLLEKKKVDGIIHIQKDPNNPIRNITVCSTNIEDVIKRCGSRYSNSSPLNNIEQYLNENKKYAFIGKPCDINALINLSKYDKRVNEQIIYKFSFFCAGLPTEHANEKLLNKLGVLDKRDCVDLKYRGNGWPGFTTAIDNNKKEYKMEYEKSWGEILGRDIRPVCRICFDGIGVNADISCSDAWYLDKNKKPIFDENEGRNAIFVHSNVGEELINEACKNKYINIEEYYDWENENQDIQKYQFYRRCSLKYVLCAMNLCKIKTPSYNKEILNKFAKKADWNLKLHRFFGTIKRVKMGKIK